MHFELGLIGFEYKQPLFLKVSTQSEQVQTCRAFAQNIYLGLPLFETSFAQTACACIGIKPSPFAHPHPF